MKIITLPCFQNKTKITSCCKLNFLWILEERIRNQAQDCADIKAHSCAFSKALCGWQKYISTYHYMFGFFSCCLKINIVLAHLWQYCKKITRAAQEYFNTLLTQWPRSKHWTLQLGGNRGKNGFQEECKNVPAMPGCLPRLGNSSLTKMGSADAIFPSKALKLFPPATNTTGFEYILKTKGICSYGFKNIVCFIYGKK